MCGSVMIHKILKLLNWITKNQKETELKSICKYLHTQQRKQNRKMKLQVNIHDVSPVETLPVENES